MANAKTWVEVDDDVARGYAYYGIGGWLLLFLILYGLGGVLGIIENVTTGLSLARYAPLLKAVVLVWGWINVVVDFVLSLWVLALVWQGFKRDPWFADRFIVFLKAAMLVKILLAAVELGAFAFLPDVAALFRRQRGGEADGWVLLVLAAVILLIVGVTRLQIWYFRDSKRVNATYRSRLLAGHPTTAELLGRA